MDAIADEQDEDDDDYDVVVVFGLVVRIGQELQMNSQSCESNN